MGLNRSDCRGIVERLGDGVVFGWFRLVAREANGRRREGWWLLSDSGSAARLAVARGKAGGLPRLAGVGWSRRGRWFVALGWRWAAWRLDCGAPLRVRVCARADLENTHVFPTSAYFLSPCFSLYRGCGGDISLFLPLSFAMKNAISGHSNRRRKEGVLAAPGMRLRRLGEMLSSSTEKGLWKARFSLIARGMPRRIRFKAARRLAERIQRGGMIVDMGLKRSACRGLVERLSDGAVLGGFCWGAGRRDSAAAGRGGSGRFQRTQRSLQGSRRAGGFAASSLEPRSREEAEDGTSGTDWTNGTAARRAGRFAADDGAMPLSRRNGQANGWRMVTAQHERP